MVLETPPMYAQVLGCMRIAGRTDGPVYEGLSKVFVAQFFLFRWVLVLHVM